jgi:hypothetical protein
MSNMFFLPFARIAIKIEPCKTKATVGTNAIFSTCSGVVDTSIIGRSYCTMRPEVAVTALALAVRKLLKILIEHTPTPDRFGKGELLLCGA